MLENVIEIKGGTIIIFDVSIKKKKNIVHAKRTLFGVLLHVFVKLTKYLVSAINNWVISYDEIIEETKTVPVNFNVKNATCRTKNFFILLAFLCITLELSIAVSIYCYVQNINLIKI